MGGLGDVGTVPGMKRHSRGGPLVRPRCPHLPVCASRSRAGADIYAVSWTEKRNLLLLTARNDVNPVRLVRSKIKFFSQNASDPSICNRSVVFAAIALD